MDTSSLSLSLFFSSSLSGNGSGIGGEEESKDLYKTYWNRVTFGQITNLQPVTIQVYGAKKLHYIYCRIKYFRSLAE